MILRFLLSSLSVITCRAINRNDLHVNFRKIIDSNLLSGFDDDNLNYLLSNELDLRSKDQTATVKPYVACLELDSLQHLSMLMLSLPERFPGIAFDRPLQMVYNIPGNVNTNGYTMNNHAVCVIIISTYASMIELSTSSSNPPLVRSFVPIHSVFKVKTYN